MKLLGLSTNFLKNIFIHISWILNPQKAVDLAQKIVSNLKNNEDKKTSIVAIGYLNEFFSKYLEYGKSNEKIVEINQKIDKNIKTDNKIANALIKLRTLRLELNKKYGVEEQLVKTSKNFGVSSGIVDGAVLNITSPTIDIPNNCIGIFPTSGPKYTQQFPKCRGIIFLNGAMTSHGAILAREFGIPAIVAPNIKIKDGTKVSINGSNGTLTYLI